MGTRMFFLYLCVGLLMYVILTSTGLKSFLKKSQEKRCRRLVSWFNIIYII